jgi:hypothetical protein
LRKLANVAATSHCGIVTPAQAGVQGTIRSYGALDARFREHDEIAEIIYADFGNGVLARKLDERRGCADSIP